MPLNEISNTWRLFVAIELPRDIRKRISDHIDHLRDSRPNARASWSREENLHLTLKFLGDTSVARVEALLQAVHRAANSVNPFEILIAGCGSFPPRGQPRVLWIGIDDPSGKLTELHQALEQECAEIGFAREPRPFRPHLTVARLRQPKGSRQLAELHAVTGFNREAISVSELLLIRSELRSEGSRHTVISRHSLVSVVLRHK